MTSVLVVDDDPVMLEVVEMVLRAGGMEVSTFSSGHEAILAARHRPPDCAVLDVTMPGMSGLQVCRALRADPQTASTPIILLTGRGQWLDVASGFAAGADDYLVKPFSGHDLLSRVEALADPGSPLTPTSPGPSITSR